MSMSNETVNQLVERLVLRTECEKSLAEEYLQVANSVVMSRLYPYIEDLSSLETPIKYNNHILNIAEYLINKRGAEGQTMHTENGISRVYENGGVPDSFLVDVIPYGKFI